MGRRRAQRREHGAVAAQRDHHVARLELSPRRHLAILGSDSGDLEDLQAVSPGPAFHGLERPVDLTLWVDDQRDPRRLGQLAQFSIVTSVPIGMYGYTFAAAAAGSSTQPTLWGVPNVARLNACTASPPLK